MKNKDSTQAGKRIRIRNKNETVYIKPGQVTHLTCEGYVSTLHRKDRVSFPVARLLKCFETFLTGDGFIRVNHNTKVNIIYIERSKPIEGYTLQLCGGQEITISRRKFSAVKEFLSEI